MPSSGSPAVAMWFKGLSAIVLAVCVVFFVAGTMHWPLVNDAAYQHYVVLILEHHEAPYRTIVDYQLPGTYFVDWAAMHLLGTGAGGARAYDLILLLVAGIAMWRICRPYGRFAGIYAAMLFALFHARDGIAQAGQRDLTVATLLLVGAAFLLSHAERRSLIGPMIFGLCVGFAGTVKPTAILFLLCAAFVRNDDAVGNELEERRHDGGRWRAMATAFCGAMVAPAVAVVWVASMGSLGAFWVTLTEFIPLHARLGDRGWAYLLRWCFTPSVDVFVILTALLLLFRRRQRRTLDSVQAVLLVGVLCGLASYFLQMKGFPYHRYPALAFLFPLAAIELSLALSAGRPWRYVGYAGVLFGVVLGPIYARRAIRSRWMPDSSDSLEQDLASVANPASIASLNGEVQCIDSISGCIEVLNHFHLVQATGQLQDELLMAPANKTTPSERGAVAQMRRTFLQELDDRPPRVIVVSRWLFPGGPDDFNKLERWPALEDYLGACFAERDERMFDKGSNGPAGYRVYVRRDACRSELGVARR